MVSVTKRSKHDVTSNYDWAKNLCRLWTSIDRCRSGPVLVYSIFGQFVIRFSPGELIQINLEYRDEWPQEYLQWFLIDHLSVYIFREFCDVTTVCRQEAPWVISPLYNDNECLVFISVGQFFEFRSLLTMQPYQGFINGLEVQTKYIQWEFTFSTVIRFEKQTPMGIYRDMRLPVLFCPSPVTGEFAGVFSAMFIS